MWNGKRFALHRLKRAAGPAGDCPLAESVHGTERNGDAMLIEPFGNLAVGPVFAAQGEDGFAMRFQSAARSALLFGFGCWLQIHIWTAQ